MATRRSASTISVARRAGILLSALAALAAAPTTAQNAYAGLPAPLQRIAFEQRLGETVDLSLIFRDETGARISLADIASDRPIVLAMVYYECPMLCSMTLSGVVSSLRAVELNAGDDFDVVVVSIDPEEGPALAKAAKATAFERYRRAGTEGGWHFLTGEQESIAQLADTVGFRFVYNEETDEFSHAAGIVVLTPEGQVSRYLLGIEFPAKDLRLSLIESSERKIGTLVDQALLFCYHYDPAKGTYSAATLNLVRLAGALTVLIILAFILLMVRRDRRAALRLGEPEHVA